ncbi:hypothetical protein K443DRAFT_541935 [Laccaria amethystina LaAM-08-1]|uniref:Uncharacterized protein n=1 Tax=Laccaria amethystina LaAM-08-1 TaxID=1095629 RepID=A0A0C9Y1W9_9AGAR|nr:hypothetical protein K443DRAFT_541935 [Laccaria amethystina LaAM-08-1]
MVITRYCDVISLVGSSCFILFVGMLYRSKRSVINVYANIVESLVKVPTSGPSCCSLILCGEHPTKKCVLIEDSASSTYSKPNEAACCDMPKRTP